VLTESERVGNTAAHTEGGILVGRGQGVDEIGDSREALTALLARIEAGITAGTCEIEIVDAPDETIA
jgi:hypothetical protein